MHGEAMLDVRLQIKAFASLDNGPGAPVLRNIEFCALPGEVVAILGHSGIGKSTLLRICIGLDRDFVGSVRMPPGKLGVMFQEPRLLPWLTVEENLRLVQPALDVSAVLEEVLLPGVEKVLPSALSLGMARRVALARALAVYPNTLVLDEPLASLDRSIAAALGARIAERATRHGVLVILSTHDLDQALAMASRIIVLADNPATLSADIVVPAGDAAGETSRLREHLLTKFTFLGSQEMAKP
ncbi:MAG: ATP-binding cassette domain-containing protein [Rhodopila sp.]|jgi:NitT/TauT family transport system ATP-binding protein